jgi:hypothetical protein
MSREKQEAELVREAIRVGGLYMQKRGVGEFEATDSASEKTRALYRLLVKDQLIQPLARDQENERNMKHKLALWIERQLPAGHPLKS